MYFFMCDYRDDRGHDFHQVCGAFATVSPLAAAKQLKRHLDAAGYLVSFIHYMPDIKTLEPDRIEHLSPAERFYPLYGPSELLVAYYKRINKNL